jgi:hypothetical protein
MSAMRTRAGRRAAAAPGGGTAWSRDERTRESRAGVSAAKRKRETTSPRGAPEDVRDADAREHGARAPDRDGTAEG